MKLQKLKTLLGVVALSLLAFTAHADLARDLNRAVEQQDIRKIKALIEKGADVNFVVSSSSGAGSPGGETALMVAVKSGAPNLGIIQYLLKHGADINTRNAAGQTALMFMADGGLSGNIATFKFLLDNNADVTSKTALGNTALHFAAANGRGCASSYQALGYEPDMRGGVDPESESLKGIQMLLKYGAQAGTANTQGNTPLHIVVRCFSLSDTSTPSAVAALTKAGADPNQKDGQGSVPLQFIAERQDDTKAASVIKALLTAGAEPNFKDASGDSLLHTMIKTEKEESDIKALLAGGAEPNVKNTKGDTPLHIAVDAQHHGAAEALLAAKADPCITDAKHYTPYQRSHHGDKAITLLLDHARGGDLACDERLAAAEEESAVDEAGDEQASADKQAGAKAEVLDKTQSARYEPTAAEIQLVGEMIRIPGGSFQMGSNAAEADEDEQPVHTVAIAPFWLGKYEVTQGQWQAVMGGNPSYHKDCGADCPVEQVNWDEVQEFINRLNQQTGGNYRLPSEAEWEYACRSGGQDEKYCGGNDPEALAWYRDNSGGKTHPVGGKRANGLGLHDMSGNVWEWVSDCRNANYQGAPVDGSAWLSGDCRQRLERGGSWGNLPVDIRSAFLFRE